MGNTKKQIPHESLEWTYDAIVVPDGCPKCGTFLVLSESGACHHCGIGYSVEVVIDD